MAKLQDWRGSHKEILCRGQHRVLELMALGRPLREVLDALCMTVEGALPDAICSVLLLDGEGKRVLHASAPSMPLPYCRAIDRQPIGPAAGSCGTAAYHRACVVVDDVGTNPLWESYRKAALESGLAACASVPILAGSDQHLLGTFALYHRTAGPFQIQELELLDEMQDLAAIAILNHERERTIERLQREESLAILAAGVAHDFNNLLTVMQGNLDLLERGLPEDDAKLVTLTRDARIAVQNASSLTEQLLAFAGKTRLEFAVVDLNAVIDGVSRLLSVAVPPQIDLELRLAPGLPRIEADATQLQQVALNLVTNAAEAIDGREGRIVLSTRDVDLGERDSQVVVGEALRPGRYVVLEVEDDGGGMQPDVVAHVFDPFYTTKVSGRGLGLAVIRGVVRAHHGGVALESEPGQGTKFSLYFPVSKSLSDAAPATRPEQLAPPSQAPRQVLLVDDEPLVLKVTKAMLELLGHSVETAVDGQQAVDIVDAQRGAFDLVILDVQMPVMGGVEAARLIREQWPDLPIVFTSARAFEPPVEFTRPRHPPPFMQKPFTLEALRRLLDQSPPPTRHPRGSYSGDQLR